jgi:predicted transcriptional regulator YheO
MRQTNSITITVPNRPGIPVRLLAIPGDDDERWTVPVEYVATVNDPNLTYLVRLHVVHDADTHLAEIVELTVGRRAGGIPVHSAGLRSLPIAQLLRDAERASANYETTSADLGGVFVVDETIEAKKLRREHVTKLTDKRSRTGGRANSPSVDEANYAREVVEALRARGVRDWEAQACRLVNVSRPTLYRRLRAAGWKPTRTTKKPATKKPATKKPATKRRPKS